MIFSGKKITSFRDKNSNIRLICKTSKVPILFKFQITFRRSFFRPWNHWQTRSRSGIWYWWLILMEKNGGKTINFRYRWNKKVQLRPTANNTCKWKLSISGIKTMLELFLGLKLKNLYKRSLLIFLKMCSRAEYQMNGPQKKKPINSVEWTVNYTLKAQCINVQIIIFQILLLL